MVQIITPEMIGWKPLTDISDIKHDDFFPFIAFREKISDNWTVKLYNGSSYWDRATQKAVDYNDFKKNWIETFYPSQQNQCFGLTRVPKERWRWFAKYIPKFLTH